jgi:hypothetical protein
MARLYYNRGGTASGTPVAISGAVLEISGDVVQISGQPVKVSGESVFVYISGGTLTATADISGQSVYVYISGGTVTATADISGQVVDISGQTVYVGESYTIQRNLGSSQSVVVATTYVAPQPTIVDAVNLNIASLPATVSSGTLSVEILTSSALFPFVRNSLDYRTTNKPTAKSICYYPNPQLCIASGDIVNVKYINNTSEYAEARIEIILRSVR